MAIGPNLKVLKNDYSQQNLLRTDLICQRQLVTQEMDEKSAHQKMLNGATVAFCLVSWLRPASFKTESASAVLNWR
jgi:hypothetical protein